MSFPGKAKYVGQCDALRRCGDEAAWQQMMKQAKPISKAEFFASVDLSAILDDPSESPDEYFAGDPNTQFFVSKWHDRDCFFAQMAGFEFIWTK